MRTWFAPDEAAEFAAAKAVLLRRCLVWAGERGRPADELLLSAAVDSRHHSRDGRIAYWDGAQIRRFLLAWVPKHVVAPREVLDLAPDVLRTYVRYLAATGLRDPRGCTPEEADAAITRAAVPFRRTLDAGRTDADHHVLEELLEARFTEPALSLDETRAAARPPIALPPPADLTAAAARSATVRHLTALVTGSGDVSAVPGLLRAWADVLGPHAAGLIADPEALWRRAFDVLPELGQAAGASLPRLFGRLLPVVLDTLYGMDDVPLTCLEKAVRPACRQGFDEDLPRETRRHCLARDLARTLEVLSDLGAVELTRGPLIPLHADLLHADPHHADLLGTDPHHTGPHHAGPHHAGPHHGGLRHESLFREGLFGEDDHPESPAFVPLARLTPLALRAVRERLLADGHDAPLLGELSTARPAELLGVLTQHYPPREAAAELNGWLSRPGQDVECLLRAVSACPFRSRATTMLGVLVEALPEGDALLRELRHDLILGPTALTLLMDVGEIEPMGLGQREHLLLGAENFLTMLEVGGPQALIAQLRGLAGREAYRFVESVLASGHHDDEGLEDLRDLVAEPLRLTYSPGPA
ncbi:hypothetical protein GCM10009733_025760 [Nonomuraea maheshkhaliensis]|uniref:Uncharacterized protein n=1 Tax=Nonomuraea maheshkhaliensis TaxID=419590 RepID=A0ABN2F4L5_9ACTN